MHWIWDVNDRYTRASDGRATEKKHIASLSLHIFAHTRTQCEPNESAQQCNFTANGWKCANKFTSWRSTANWIENGLQSKQFSAKDVRIASDKRQCTKSDWRQTWMHNSNNRHCWSRLDSFHLSSIGMRECHHSHRLRHPTARSPLNLHLTSFHFSG